MWRSTSASPFNICISVQQDPLQSCPVTPVLPAELIRSGDNSWQYPDNATQHRPDFKVFKRPKARETLSTFTGADLLLSWDFS